MDTTSTTCPHCTKGFSTVGTLKTHLKSNKMCSVLQGRPPPPNPVCSYCNESYSTVYRLRDHMEKCAKTFGEKKDNEDLRNEVKTKDEQIAQMKADHARWMVEKELEKKRELEVLRAKKDRDIDELRDELFECRMRIARLEQACDDNKERLQESKEMLAKSIDDITKIAAQTKITNTNVVIQGDMSLDLSNTTEIRNILTEHLDGSVLCQGQRGLAQMVVDRLLTSELGKRKYTCSDPSRQRFEYVDTNGETVTDIKAAKLKTALVQSGLHTIAMDNGEKLWRRDDGSTDSGRRELFHPQVMEVATLENVDKDDSKFRTELVKLTTS